MTDSKRRTTYVPKIMLNFSSTGSTSSSSKPRRASDSKSRSRKNCWSPTRGLVPSRLPSGLVPSSVTSGLKGLVVGESSKRRSVRPIQSSVTSSITIADFDDDLSGMLHDAGPPMTNLRRCESMDSDSKPLRPFRRGSSEAHIEHHKSDYQEPTTTKKSIVLSHLDGQRYSCVHSSVSSSITFRDFDMSMGSIMEEEQDFAADAPAPPLTSMRRAVSMDSDSKPLRPFRRDSSTQTEPKQQELDYPEPVKNPMITYMRHAVSLDSLPSAPRRKASGKSSSSGMSESDHHGRNAQWGTSKKKKKSPTIRRLATTAADMLPFSPNRKGSIGPNSSLEDTVGAPPKLARMDSSPCVPGRRSSMDMDTCEAAPPPTELRERDSQPSVPGRKTSLLLDISSSRHEVSASEMSEEFSLLGDDESKMDASSARHRIADAAIMSVANAMA